MAKSTVDNIISEIKGVSDYDITDSDLDSLILKFLNKNLKIIKQLLLDNFLSDDVTQSAYFKTVEDQEYVDLLNARIVGDVATFTAVAGDKITVTIDGTAYTTGALTGAVLVATVVTAINLATAAIGDVAAESDDGYLVITSPTSGSTSSVVIADDTGTPASRLFTVAAERTQNAIYDVDEILSLSERSNDNTINPVLFNEYRRLHPDPTASYAMTPDIFSRHDDLLYFGPTPNDNIYIYIDYYIDVATAVAGGNMPFRNKYDPLIVAMCKKDLKEWLDDQNAVGITVAKKEVDELIDTLIINATKNIGLISQSQSRDDDEGYFSPRKPTS